MIHVLGKLFRLGLALVFIAMVAGSGVTAQQPITVCATGCTHTSIQEAISAVPDGSEIQVKAGTYTESLTISRPVSLVGEGLDTTILEGAVAIAATQVSLTGFTVKGQGIQVKDSTTITLLNDAIIESSSDGLSIANSTAVTVQGNKIRSNTGSGVVITPTSQAVFTGNVMTG